MKLTEDGFQRNDGLVSGKFERRNREQIAEAVTRQLAQCRIRDEDELDTHALESASLLMISSYRSPRETISTTA